MPLVLLIFSFVNLFSPPQKQQGCADVLGDIGSLDGSSMSTKLFDDMCVINSTMSSVTLNNLVFI